MDNQKNGYAIPLAIIIAALIVGLAIYFRQPSPSKPAPEKAGNLKEEKTTSSSSKEAKSLLTLKTGDYVLGNPEAKITLVEFGDFQCPFCGRFFSTTEKQIKEAYIKTGKAKFIWRDFAFLGQESVNAAQAARCAGEQGKFWEYHDYLFEHQKGENLGTFAIENLKGFADDLKLSAAEFSFCLDSKKYLSAVEEETRFAKDLGIDGTPTTFVNDKMVPGAVPFSFFEKEIKQILGE